MTRVQQVGERIEELLAALGSADDGRPPVPGRRDAGELAEELVGLLVGLYGDGLSRIVAVAREQGAAGVALVDTLADDPLVGSLLLLHDLHPLDVDTRIQRALDRVRPYLGSHAGGVRYLGVADGTALLRLEGSCHGCPSSTVTVKLAISGAVRDAAPEVSEVVVEGMTEPPAREQALLQIGPRPEPSGGAAVRDAPGGAGEWVALPDFGPPSSRPVATSAAGMPVLLCSVRGTLYAYRDRCPACGEEMGAARLDREVLTCRCGVRYDVSRVGAGLDDPALRLDPLPLLSDSQGVRVAVPAPVRS